MREYLGTPSRAPSAADTVAPTAARLWSADPGRGTLGLPAVGDRIITLATTDRWVYAIDARSGQPLWRHRSDHVFSTGPVMGDGSVYAGTDAADGIVTAIDLLTGKRRWLVRVGDVSSPLALRDTVLYVATQRRATVFALDTRTGRSLWTRTVGPSRSGTLVTSGHVAVVTLTDTLFALDRRTGAVVQRVPLGTSTSAPLALADDSVAIVTSQAGSVLAVSVPGAKVLWRVETKDPIPGTAAVVGDTVFALTSRCTLWRIPLRSHLDASSVALGAADSAGGRAQQCVTVAGPTIVSDGVLVATVPGEVLLFDRRSGARLWARRVDGELRQPPVVHRRQIVVAPAFGNVVSFR